MHRSKILSGLTLASLMLVMLTGCSSIIAAIVGSSESVQQALDQAQAGDTIQVMGTHDEDVTIDKDNITITSDDGASIDGNVTVDANNVTIANMTVTGVLDTVPGSFKNLTLDNVVIWGVMLNDTYSCNRIVQSGEVIQDAIDASGAGDSICVAPGTYAETLTFNDTSADGLTIHGFGLPEVTGGILLDNDTNDLNGLALKHVALKGDADPGGDESIIRNNNAAAVFDFEMDGCLVDGENVEVDADGGNGRFGITGNKFGGTFKITNTEFKNIRGWALLDMDASSDYSPIGGNGLPLTAVTFSNNYIHDSNGTVALRGNHTSRTAQVNVIGNRWEHIGGVGGSTGMQWAALEVNNTLHASVRDNVVRNVQAGIYGEGQAFQFWNVDTIDMHDNDITNNAQGIYFYSDGVGGTFCGTNGCPVPGGSIYDNNIVGNTDYGLKIEAAASGGPLTAEDNWWGDASGPTHASNPGGTGDAVSDNVDFDPWATSPF